MSKTYKEWLEYYSNATKEQVIEDLTQDNLEIERLHNLIKEVRETIEKLDNGTFIDYGENSLTAYVSPEPCCRARLDKILEILDKEEQCTK